MKSFNLAEDMIERELDLPHCNTLIKFSETLQDGRLRSLLLEMQFVDGLYVNQNTEFLDQAATEALYNLDSGALSALFKHFESSMELQFFVMELFSNILPAGQ